ncbi:lanthionine synthetase C family protein [Archangium violaceum]|uniref:lanthionine synthetase C family protein n=1 Tax=Archangium violaceum TaxID=83451 RepID=UPI00193AE61F|nr:lanthionine synthetase C family protein [Archangium violaceum]QRK11344.1 lanthionine synthetase C family protein [Archangium violaceum]
MTPLLSSDEALALQVRRTVEEISTALSGVTRELPGLSSGLAGMAVFHAYFHRTFQHEPSAERAQELMSRAMELLAESQQPPSLFGGFTGVAWALLHLSRELGLSEDEEPTADVDELLLTHVGRSPWRGAYELIDGLVGYGVYACERIGSPRGRAILEQVVLRLEELAVSRTEGLSWYTPPELLPEWQRALYPQGYYNLGVAHGVPGVILLLARACVHGVAEERARMLLEGAVRWLLAQRDSRDARASFGTVISAGAPVRRPSRIAWCYGDLGLSVALLQAARSVGRSDWEDEALRTARRAAERPSGESGVRDAGLCHGAAGNAHLFHRLYSASGEAVFREASRAWLVHTLELRHEGEGFAGFRVWQQDASGESWIASPGLLSGASGVGLALLAALGPVEPEWDRLFLASAR